MACSVGRKSISASKRNLKAASQVDTMGPTELGNLLLKTVKTCCRVTRLTISPQCPAIFIPFLWGRLLPHLGHCIDYLGACFVVPLSLSVKTPLMCSGPSTVCQRCPVFDHCIAPKVKSAVSLSASQRPFSQLAWTQCRVLDMCRFSGLSHGYCFLWQRHLWKRSPVWRSNLFSFVDLVCDNRLWMAPSRQYLD